MGNFKRLFESENIYKITVNDRLQAFKVVIREENKEEIDRWNKNKKEQSELEFRLNHEFLSDRKKEKLRDRIIELSKIDYQTEFFKVIDVQGKNVEIVPDNMEMDFFLVDSAKELSKVFGTNYKGKLSLFEKNTGSFIEYAKNIKELEMKLSYINRKMINKNSVKGLEIEFKRQKIKFPLN